MAFRTERVSLQAEHPSYFHNGRCVASLNGVNDLLVAIGPELKEGHTDIDDVNILLE